MEEKDTLEAGALAIRNLGVIERAYQLINNEISNKLVFIYEKCINDCLPAQGWKKELPCLETEGYSDKTSWFSPMEWCPGEVKDSLAWFAVRQESPEGTDDLWFLTQLCGQGKAQTGIRWEGDHKLIRPNGGNLSKWKIFTAEQNSKNPELNKLGFRYEEGGWFFPLVVDANLLADAYANEEMESVLKPVIENCMQKILEAIPTFQKIMNTAKSNQ
ncbi:MAG: hypothetical protein Q8O64_16840 [Sideroxyarcus sp.]|nr:hypothetical protein [Sideroxyarcus sp.]